MSEHDRETGVHPLAKPFLGLGDTKVRNRISLIILALAAGLLITDFIVHRHEYLSLAETRGFYALFGFGAFAIAVLSGWPLGALLRRNEDYYNEPDDDA